MPTTYLRSAIRNLYKASEVQKILLVNELREFIARYFRKKKAELK